VSEPQTETVGLAEVNTLRRAGLVSAVQYLDAVYRCREPDYWTRWALRALLALGAGHLLAGIIFFFAYNWDSLSVIARFAVLQSGIVVSVAGALIVRLDRAGGQVLLIAASILTGTLLAVIGQVYQTGADPYELFTVWGALILPWVIASRSAAHWFVWLLVVCVAFILYGIQVLVPLEVLSAVELFSALGLVIAIALAVREGAVLAGAGWLDFRWTRALLAFATLAIVFVPATRYVLDWGSEAIGGLTFVALILAMGVVYARLLADFAVLAIGTGFVSLFLMAIGLRALEETIGFEWRNAASILPSLVLLVLWCAALTAGTLKLLAALRARLANGESHG
jgi:uncharacterized membrane protein